MHVVVTGSGQGIGKYLALELSRDTQFTELTLVSRSNNVHKTKAEIEENSGIKVNTFVADIGIADELNGLVNLLHESKPNALVNSAGILGKSSRFYDIEDSDLIETFRTNVIGSLNMINACLPFFKESRSGRIVNFGGGGAAYAYPDFLPYALSKVSIIRMTENMASELKIEGFKDIFVNSIAPGAVKTQMLEEVLSKGGIVKTTVDISEPIALIKFLILNNNPNINGRFIHSRDDYNDIELFDDPENLMLRRIENWKE